MGPSGPVSARRGGRRRGLVDPAPGVTRDRLLPAVVQAQELWSRRVPTAALNRWLEEALAAHPPPMAKGRRLKIRYATQVSTRPPPSSCS
jgi:predicted GTPase